MLENIAHMDATDHRSEDAALVRAFVRRHFSWRGSLRMHGASLGLDLLRAPINVALAPVFLFVRIAALVLSRLRLVRAGRWLASRRILLRSDASRALERALCDDLLERRTWRGNTDPAIPARHVEDYLGIRSAVAEIATTLLVLIAGLLVFRAATPGVLSLAPLVSERAAFNAAVAGFPLGESLGRAWYGLFPADQSVWFVAGVGITLVVAGSIVTTFAGVVADPLQALLGVHQRRLLRLLARIDAAEGDDPGLAREHLLARMADVLDAAAALLRMLRP